MSNDSGDLQSALAGYKKSNTAIASRHHKIEEIHVGRNDIESIRSTMNPQTTRYDGNSIVETLSLQNNNGKIPLPHQKKSPDRLIFQDGKVPTWVEEDIQSLSPEQKKTYVYCLQGYNVFFTGDAGTGKSFVLQKIVNMLRRIKGSNHVYITASTGIAACNIGGITLHSFAGIGIGTEEVSELVKKIKQNKKNKEKWITCQVLVIDEISMLDGSLLSKIEYIARQMKQNDLPFGGIQLILSGDFFQLPPVGLGSNGVIYCFQSLIWKSVVEKYVQLRTVYRQKDTQLQQLLREIRHGYLTKKSESILQSMSSTPLENIKEISPTKLYPYNNIVDTTNEKNLEQLSGETYQYKCIDEGNEPYLSILKKNCSAPELLTLRIGAQVMLLKNLDVSQGLVNGARGIVTGFDSIKPYLPIIKFYTNGLSIIQQIEYKEWKVESGQKILATRKQIPLKLAWSISIHKSQGMTIDLLEVNLKGFSYGCFSILLGVFEKGMAYVALSRGVDIHRIRVLGFEKRSIQPNNKVEQFYREIEQQEKKEEIEYKNYEKKQIEDYDEVHKEDKEGNESRSSFYLPQLPPPSSSVCTPFKSPRSNSITNLNPMNLNQKKKNSISTLLNSSTRSITNQNNLSSSIHSESQNNKILHPSLLQPSPKKHKSPILHFISPEKQSKDSKESKISSTNSIQTLQTSSNISILSSKLSPNSSIQTSQSPKPSPNTTTPSSKSSIPVQSKSILSKQFIQNYTNSSSIQNPMDFSSIENDKEIDQYIQKLSKKRDIQPDDLEQNLRDQSIESIYIFKSNLNKTTHRVYPNTKTVKNPSKQQHIDQLLKNMCLSLNNLNQNYNKKS